MAIMQGARSALGYSAWQQESSVAVGVPSLGGVSSSECVAGAGSRVAEVEGPCSGLVGPQARVMQSPTVEITPPKMMRMLETYLC